MENTLSIYVDSLHEQWEMPDSLAIKWQQYEAEHPVEATNADHVHTAWFNSLTPEEQDRITKRKTEE